MTRSQEIYEKVNKLTESGTSRPDAFKRVAEEHAFDVAETSPAVAAAVAGLLVDSQSGAAGNLHRLVQVNPGAAAGINELLDYLGV